MSTALPSTAGTPQPSGLHNQVPASPAQAFAQAQLQQQQLQAQSMFRQKQLMAQKQQQQQIQQIQQMQQQQLFQQQPQLLQQHQKQQQQQLQQQMAQQQQHQQHLLQQQQQQQQQHFHQQQLLHQQQQSLPPQNNPQQQPNTPQRTPQMQQQQQQQPTPRISTLPPSTPVMGSQGSPAPAMSKVNAVVGAQQRQTNGQAVLRLLQFAEQLSPGQEEAVDRLFWDDFVHNFFTMQGILKLGLTNAVDNEQKDHEVNQALLARFFHTQYMCGVVSIQMTLDKTMEYILPGGIMYVQCPRASFINRYKNGTLVVSTGPLWVQFVMTANGEWKIGHMDFSCQGHEEYVTRTTIKTEPVPSSKKKIPPHQSVIPESPINNWGLPPRVYHILQIADIALRTSEVLFHSIVTGSSARESLGAVALDKQPRLMMKNEREDMKPHPIDTPIVSGMATVASSTTTATAAAADSPIVKTQTGRPHQQFTPLQQQAALRQQQQQAAFQFHQQQQRQQQFQLQQQQGPLTPGHQMAYQQQLQMQQQQQLQAQQHLQQQQQQLQAQAQSQPLPIQQPPQPQQPSQKQAYPNQFPTQSPVSRKRNSTANDVKSPVTKKRTAGPAARKQ
ncbi:hypothetical protein [Parasitella parasitica]|uniref:LIM-domain binding protein-domain-containing protein n=1 Tax=Parasitella parasitica TaxID=35722 RepID=A0A0B7MSK8_9FUNG|nr:hypothetical protein [Parasitella parasitica]